MIIQRDSVGVVDGSPFINLKILQKPTYNFFHIVIKEFLKIKNSKTVPKEKVYKNYSENKWTY